MAVCCVNVGVSSVQVSPTSKKAADAAAFSRLYVSPLPTISMKGSTCSTGLSFTTVSITPACSTSFESFAASVSVNAMFRLLT